MKNNNTLLTDKDFLDNGLINNNEQILIRRRLSDWLLLARDSKPENTLKAYRQDWQHFFHWCQSGKSFLSDQSNPKQALPASIETLIDYIELMHLPRSDDDYLRSVKYTVFLVQPTH